MFKVLLVDEVNGNCYKRVECEDLFACEVFVDHKKYDAPKDCHYEIASDLALERIKERIETDTR